MKKSLFLIFTVLSIFFITDNVYATTITDNYSFSDRYYLNGSTLEGVYEKNTTNYSYGGFSSNFSNTFSNYYNYFYYTGTNADIFQNAGIQWSNKDWCSGDNIIFTGYLVPQKIESARYMFKKEYWDLSIEVPQDSYKSSCSTEVVSKDNTYILKFTCGVPKSNNTTRSFKFLLTANTYYESTAYWGIQKSTFNYSCDVDSIDIINSQNKNTQDIINNQNSNSQNIINNQTQNSQNIINNQNSNSQNIINNQNQNQQQTNEKLEGINDSLTNSKVEGGTGSSFFNNFSTTDNGGISSIITAPLVAINSMLDNTCSPMSVTYKDKEVSLPCGTEFWTKASTIQDYLNWFEGGILVYSIIRKLYKLIESMKNPDDDRVEVMDL